MDLSVAGAGSLVADIYVSGLGWQGEPHEVLAALDSPPVTVRHRKLRRGGLGLRLLKVHVGLLHGGKSS